MRAYAGTHWTRPPQHFTALPFRTSIDAEQGITRVWFDGAIAARLYQRQMQAAGQDVQLVDAEEEADAWLRRSRGL